MSDPDTTNIRPSVSVVDWAPGVVVVSSTSSDCHTWNLIFLELVIKESGHRVVNLGACVPDEELVRKCCSIAPDMVVISTVNGHGVNDGLRLGPLLRKCDALSKVPLFIGGMLAIDGPSSTAVQKLMNAGFDAVFNGADDDLVSFVGALEELHIRAAKRER